MHSVDVHINVCLFVYIIQTLYCIYVYAQTQKPFPDLAMSSAHVYFFMFVCTLHIFLLKCLFTFIAHF